MACRTQYKRSRQELARWQELREKKRERMKQRETTSVPEEATITTLPATQ